MLLPNKIKQHAKINNPINKLPYEIPKKALAEINISEETWINHVKALHFEKNLDKSYFYKAQEKKILRLLKKTEVIDTEVKQILSTKDKLNPVTGEMEYKGNYYREYHHSSIIGIDKTTGRPTNILSIITDKDGNLLTTFPGKFDAKFRLK